MTTEVRAPNDERGEFPARLASLHATAAFVQAFCDRHRLPRATALHLTLVVEELFTNSVTHGHGGDSDQTIVIDLSARAGSVLLGYADAAPRFDPRPRLRTPPESLGAPADERPTGGLGLHLVGRLASRVRYAYRGGNRIVLAMPIACGSADA
ncbi:MAG TPA: ATP-binding protein [Burkholderiaceae bacterium]|jgi:serine/threonine-protein kinase RsbW|nr:ATP-binding protein [Burkholderiaceae bacterium]